MSCNLDPMKDGYENPLLDIKRKLAFLLLLMNHAYISVYNIRSCLSREFDLLSFSCPWIYMSFKTITHTSFHLCILVLVYLKYSEILIYKLRMLISKTVLEIKKLWLDSNWFISVGLFGYVSSWWMGEKDHKGRQKPNTGTRFNFFLNFVYVYGYFVFSCQCSWWLICEITTLPKL